MRAGRFLSAGAAVVVSLGVFAATSYADGRRDDPDAAAGVKFTRHTLPAAQTDQKMRPVQPGLEVIQPWISAVGASVGALDLRGQGVDGDACLTDPRDDKLRVFPVPGSTGTPFPAFELEPANLRYDKTMAPIGCVPADINSDGRQDILAYYWGRSAVVFVNGAAPGGTPKPSDFVAHELTGPMEVWNSTALNVADIDGDGRLDVMVGNYFPDGARVLDPSATNDERMQMQRSMGQARNAGTNRLYLNKGTGADGMPVFEDQSDKWPEESARSWTLAMGMQDLKGKGVPDIWVANDFGPDQLLVNTSTPGNVHLRIQKGDRNWTTPKSKVLGRDSFKGMGVGFSYDQGAELPNILISNITSPWALQESNLLFRPDGQGASILDGEWPYREQAAEAGIAHSGWSWDVKAVDPKNTGQDGFVQATGFLRGTKNAWPRLQETAMGNDGLLEHPNSWLHLKEHHDLSGHEPARLWLPSGGGYTDQHGAVPFSGDDITRGFSIADVNGDDRMDMLVAGQWGDSYAYINESETVNPAVRLRVTRATEDGTSTPLIGAVVTLKGSDYSRKAQLYPANGHSGVSGSTLSFPIPEGADAGGLKAVVCWMDDGEMKEQEFDVPMQTSTPVSLEVPR